MLDKLYYDMIFKRKSFHVFPEAGALSVPELEAIQAQFSKLVPLKEDIRTEFRLVPRERTTCKRGEFCILVYSERKDRFLNNAGYLAEQLDLWLASQNIGVCWYGMGKPDEPVYHGLEFVIMLAVGKAGETNFRRDPAKIKRREPEAVWSGGHPGAAAVARLAPSACNTQPWRVTEDGDRLHVWQVRGKRGMMPAGKVDGYNRIDMGIFLLFLELCLEHENIRFLRELCPDPPEAQETALTAVYQIFPPSPPPAAAARDCSGINNT